MCSCECPSPFHQCRGHPNRCISPIWVCDRNEDCPEGDDEEHCGFWGKKKTLPPALICPVKHQLCRGTINDCVPLEYLCDTEKDCPEGDDEENCFGRLATNDQ
ncbi:low-density lipoprotein receptor [Elysia marginata]|uniref:Low-density lipoprotein receptor n=1 Tax=Elysia marginata TaxID=1093978 RepID=A0AAV4FNA2_9GAST|nr:low-density lipoprotein receptor [Elysia marginata]